MRLTYKIFRYAALLLATVCPVRGGAQDLQVSMTVVIMRATLSSEKTGGSHIQSPDASNAVVWLTPLDENEAKGAAERHPGKGLQLVQRHKTFEPHILVVPIGTKVEFPNRDPFFHNIFSLFNGKRFDLGLYEAGTTRTVLFDRAGVSFLFCNIHAEMSAVVVAVDTPYFALSDRSGNVRIANVPNGRYRLNVWFERASPEALKKLCRIVTISDSGRALGTIRIEEKPNFTLAHKNKYGLDYVPPPNTEYDRP